MAPLIGSPPTGQFRMGWQQLGRGGTIAARLLVELGVKPDKAIADVRTARPGAIETPGQERFVRGIVACRDDLGA